MRLDAHATCCSAAVVAHGADLGLAHDGDADRCLAVDATAGSSTATRSWWCWRWPCTRRASSPSNTLVATVMSNLGLHIAMRAAGIDVRTTGVGDRYVLEELRAGGYASAASSPDTS